MSWMTRMRCIPLIAAAVACSDANGPAGSSLPVAVSWMEWPAAVTADQPGHIRVVGYHGICGEFRLTAVQSGSSTVSVNAEEHFDGEPQFCPAVAVLFDSLVPLPPLVTTPAGSAGSFTVDAPVVDPLGTIVRRPFGFISFSNQQPDATIQVGGRAFVLEDSLGCSWLRPQLPAMAGPHVLSSDLALGTNTWHTAFISGYFAPAFSPRCGQSLLLQLRIAEVDAP